MTIEWHTYDEGSHFISCLQLVDFNLGQNTIDETNIRWIIVGLHDALYALIIEKLIRTDGFGIYPDNFENRVSDFYRKGLSSKDPEYTDLKEETFKQSIAGLSKLLSRAALNSGVKIVSSGFAECEQPTKGLSQLKQMRDFFAHPRPTSSAYDIGFVSEAVHGALQVLSEVRQMSGKKRLQHDPGEADILLASIEFYARKVLL
ncbi:MAG: hypothetical protein AAFY35_11610 [Pseudomonadota bacterium]